MACPLPSNWDAYVFSDYPVTLGRQQCTQGSAALVCGGVDNLPRSADMAVPLAGSPLPSDLSSTLLDFAALQGGITGDDRTDYGLSLLDSILDDAQDQMGLGTTPFENRQPPSPPQVLPNSSPTCTFQQSPPMEIKAEALSPAPTLPTYSPQGTNETAFPFTSPQPSPCLQSTCADWLDSLLAHTPQSISLDPPDTELDLSTLLEPAECTSTLLQPKQEEPILTDDELIALNTKELNQRLKHLHEAERKKLKHRRRTLKNRNYASNCRSKKQMLQSGMEFENSVLTEQNKQLQLQCEQYQKENLQLRATVQRFQTSLKDNVLLLEIAKLRQLLKAKENR